MTPPLISRYLPADYYDSFRQEIRSSGTISTEALLIAMFSRYPRWVAILFKLRNILVKSFGLETGQLDITSLIKEKTEQEIVIGQDDKHLEFYVAIQVIPAQENTQIIEVSTIVKYHNTLGRIYFFFIRPFHRVIVPALLKRAIRHCYS